MKKSSDICFEISGHLAMFTTPQSKMNCECISYPYPTYSSIVGILKKIYMRNGIIWVPDSCRVMNKIKMIDIPKMTPSYSVDKKNRQRYIYTYLEDVRYQIRAHYVQDFSCINSNHCHLRHDNKILNMIANGGGNVVSLGRRECVGFIRPCVWGSGEGFYDGAGESDEIIMFYKFDYDRRFNGKIKDVTFCSEKMIDGVITFDNLPKVTRKWGS